MEIYNDKQSKHSKNIYKNLQHSKQLEISINCVVLSHFINIIVGYKDKIKEHAPGLAQGKLTISP